MLKPIEVRPLPGYKLRLRYSDGVESQVDLSHLAGKGVLKIWDDCGIFQSVRVGQHGEITWNDDVDLCVDALYPRLTGITPAEVFPKLSEAPTHA